MILTTCFPGTEGECESFGVSAFPVVVAAGSLSDEIRADARFPHRWTTEGVAVQTEFTGAHLLHLSAAACILNDLYREAAAADIALVGVRVAATGDFDRITWQSTGIVYQVDLESPSTDTELAALVERVDEVAGIPRALALGASVTRGR